MSSIEIKEKTVDQAIFSGLNQLGLSIDEVEIEIINDGGKGLFGIGKSAVVRLTPKSEQEIQKEAEERRREEEIRAARGPRDRNGRDNRDRHRDRHQREEYIAPEPVIEEIDYSAIDSPPSEVEGFLNNVFNLMGIKAECKTIEKGSIDRIVALGEETSFLIGRRGETLDALQYLASLVLNHGKQDYTKVVLDTENYRKKREIALVKLANRIAGKVAKTGRKVTLEPMNPYERRVLHSTLQTHPRVETISEGEDPFRRVVVKLKKRH